MCSLIFPVVWCFVFFLGFAGGVVASFLSFVIIVYCCVLLVNCGSLVT